MNQQRITYNGWQFSYPRLAVSEQTRLSDDQSNPIGTAYTFTISGIVSDAGSGLLPLLLEMKARLTQSKKDFSVEWYNGSGWQTFWGFTGGDDAWGPTPGPLDIRQIPGGRCALYCWSVEIFRKQCFGADCSLQNAGSDVLSLSRQWDHSVDEAGYTTRTVSGILRVKRNATTTADSWRQLCLPDVPPWYKRTSQTFTQSPDGMELHYSITDVEQHWTLPKPVVKGHATYSAQLTPSDGMTVTHSLSGEFAGSASTPKKDLFDAMYMLMQAKLPSYGPSADAAFLLETINVSESVYENSIAFHIVGRAVGGGYPDLDAALLRFYVAPPGTTGSAQAPNGYGNTGPSYSSGVMAPRVTPYDACGALTGPGGTTGPSTPAGTGSVPIPAIVGLPGNPESAQRPNTTLTPAASQASTDHIQRPYLEYFEKLAFMIKNNLVVFTPKKDDNDSKPLVQQTGTPTMIIAQSGYWVRVAKDNTPIQAPTPYGWGAGVDGSTPKFVVEESQISPQNAEPFGASGWFRITLHWAYKIRVAYHLDDLLENTIYFPKDPRHKTPVNPPLGSSVSSNTADRFKFVERLSH